MWRFLAVLLVFAPPALAGERLNDAELRELLVGSTERGEYRWMGQLYEYEETYHPDGSITGKAGRRYTGTWEIRDAAICCEYDTGDSSCYAYVKDGEKYRAYRLNSDGSLGEQRTMFLHFSKAGQ